MTPATVAPLNSSSSNVTVTYLAITEAPRVNPSRLPTGSQVIRAIKPPLDYYRYLYHLVGGPWAWTDRKRLDDPSLAHIIHDSRVEINVLHVGGVPAGFAELDLRRPPEMELAYFGLAPSFIGQGLGGLFLSWSIYRAWQHPINLLTVHTCTLDHPNALANYQKRGFKIVRQITE